MQTVAADEGARVARLFDLMRRVNSSTDVDELLEEVVRGVTEVVGFGIAALRCADGDSFVMTHVAADDPDVVASLLGSRVPRWKLLHQYDRADQWGILRYIPHDRSGQDVWTEVWRAEADEVDSPDRWHPDDMLMAPLYSATGELLGNISVDVPPGNRLPDPALRELLELYAVQAGLALSNAQQRAVLAERVRLGEVVKQVAMATSLVGLDSTLARAAEVVGTGFRVDAVRIDLFRDGEGRAGEPAASWPDVRSVPALDDVAATDASDAGDGARSALAAVHRDLASSGWPDGLVVGVHVDQAVTPALPNSQRRLQGWMRAAGLTRVLVAPLGVGQELLGLMIVGRAAGGPDFDEHENTTLREVTRELGRIVLNARLYERESRLVAELQELDRYKGELIATISHELKTPLTSIIGHVELLAERNRGNPSVSTIGRNADRLDRLITNLLNYAQLQEQRLSVRVPVDLTVLARASLDLLAFQADAVGIDCRLEGEGPVVVPGDPEELGRILDNLVGNAIKYGRQSGHVTVRVRMLDADLAEVSVHDDGMGISAIDQGHLFSAFHRSSNPEALSIPGTGLGLAISKRVAELHGGTLTAESELGVGSVFSLRLPVRARAREED